MVPRIRLQQGFRDPIGSWGFWCMFGLLLEYRCGRPVAGICSTRLSPQICLRSPGASQRLVRSAASSNFAILWRLYCDVFDHPHLELTSVETTMQCSCRTGQLFTGQRSGRAGKPILNRHVELRCFCCEGLLQAKGRFHRRMCTSVNSTSAAPRKASNVDPKNGTCRSSRTRIDFGNIVEMRRSM